MNVGTELQVLAALLRPSPHFPRGVRPSGLEWDGIVSFALDHGLGGLLLERAAAERLHLPDSCLTQLQAGARAVASKNRSLERELEEIVQALNEARIPVMLLKGAALTHSVYGDPALRPMSDLDLLVHVDDANRATERLLERTCRRGVELVREDFFPRFHYEIELWTRSTCPARIDLHARPFRPLRYAEIIPDAALWHDAETVRIGLATALLPSSERMFVHLAAHAAFHGCSRLIWLYDLVRWCERRRETIDWDRTIGLCRAWGLADAVRTAMKRTRDVFGHAWPAQVEQELARSPGGWRDRVVLRQAPQDAASPLRHVLCNLATAPGIRFRLGYLRAVLFPQASHLATSYTQRHAGWRAAAIARRLLRAAARVLGLARAERHPGVAT